MQEAVPIRILGSEFELMWRLRQGSYSLRASSDGLIIVGDKVKVSVSRSAIRQLGVRQILVMQTETRRKRWGGWGSGPTAAQSVFVTVGKSSPFGEGTFDLFPGDPTWKVDRLEKWVISRLFSWVSAVSAIPEFQGDDLRDWAGGDRLEKPYEVADILVQPYAITNIYAEPEGGTLQATAGGPPFEQVEAPKGPWPPLGKVHMNHAAIIRQLESLHMDKMVSRHKFSHPVCSPAGHEDMCPEVRGPEGISPSPGTIKAVEVRSKPDSKRANFLERLGRKIWFRHIVRAPEAAGVTKDGKKLRRVLSLRKKAKDNVEEKDFLSVIQEDDTSYDDLAGTDYDYQTTDRLPATRLTSENRDPIIEEILPDLDRQQQQDQPEVTAKWFELSDATTEYKDYVVIPLKLRSLYEEDHPTNKPTPSGNHVMVLDTMDVYRIPEKFGQKGPPD